MPENDQDKKLLTVKIDKELHRKFKLITQHQDLTMSEIVIILIEQYVNKFNQ